MSKKKDTFLEFVLFNPDAFKILLKMSYIVGFIVFAGLTAIAAFANNAWLTIIFAMFAGLALRNVIKFWRFGDKTKNSVADMMNTVMSAKEVKDDKKTDNRTGRKGL